MKNLFDIEIKSLKNEEFQMHISHLLPNYFKIRYDFIRIPESIWWN